jgi:FkbM family methyltransferase
MTSTGSSRRRRLPRLDLLEVGALLGVVAVAGVGFWYASFQRSQAVPSAEARHLRDTYGPDRFSQHGEEWIVRDFFREKRDGFFVDVGAHHYRDFSNTYYLETELGWKGIAIEPQTEFAADYARHRPNTIFRSFFVSDASNEQAKLYVQKDRTLVSSGNQDFNRRYGDGAVSAVDVPTITLNDLLDHEGVTSIDLLTMDIELWEPKALAGFDIERFRPRLVCIEGHPDVRQDILDYFARHGYVIEGRYLRADVWNLYFRPLG